MARFIYKFRNFVIVDVNRCKNLKTAKKPETTTKIPKRRKNTETTGQNRKTPKRPDRTGKHQNDRTEPENTEVELWKQTDPKTQRVGARGGMRGRRALGVGWAYGNISHLSKTHWPQLSADHHSARPTLSPRWAVSSRPASGCVFFLRPPDGTDRDAVTILCDQTLEMK